MTEYYKKIVVTENDYGNDITLHCRINTTDFDLTGYTCTFTMIKRGATTAKVSKQSCTITSATEGECTYTWASGNLDTVGTYDAEVECTKTGVVQTFKGLTIIVNDEGA